MCIDKLRQDVRDLGIKFECGDYDGDGTYGAQTDYVDGHYVILIKSGLDSEQKIEAEAHELGHLLCEGRGWLVFRLSETAQAQDQEIDVNFFSLAINNYIQHKNIIRILEEEYQIKSDAFLQILEADALRFCNKIDEYASNELGLCVTAISLCDIYSNIASHHSFIDETFSRYEILRETRNAVNSLLSTISNAMSPSAQKEIFMQFIDCVEGWTNINRQDMITNNSGN